MAERRRRGSASDQSESDTEDANNTSLDTSKERTVDSECVSEGEVALGTTFETAAPESDEFESANEEHDGSEEEETDTETEGDEDDDDDDDEDVIVEGDEDGSINEERQSGDGQEQPDDETGPLDDDEDRKNPAFIPRRGEFYEHDNRSGDSEDKEKNEDRNSANNKQLWQEDTRKWGHDKFSEEQQAPKSTDEIIAMYGYDIRDADKPPEDLPRYSDRKPRVPRSNQPRNFGDFFESDNSGGRGRGRGRGNRGGYQGDRRNYSDFQQQGGQEDRQENRGDDNRRKDYEINYQGDNRNAGNYGNRYDQRTSPRREFRNSGRSYKQEFDYDNRDQRSYANDRPPRGRGGRGRGQYQGRGRPRGDFIRGVVAQAPPAIIDDTPLPASENQDNAENKSEVTVDPEEQPQTRYAEKNQNPPQSKTDGRPKRYSSQRQRNAPDGQTPLGKEATPPPTVTQQAPSQVPGGPQPAPPVQTVPIQQPPSTVGPRGPASMPMPQPNFIPPNQPRQTRPRMAYSMAAQIPNQPPPAVLHSPVVSLATPLVAGPTPYNVISIPAGPPQHYQLATPNLPGSMPVQSFAPPPGAPQAGPDVYQTGNIAFYNADQTPAAPPPGTQPAGGATYYTPEASPQIPAQGITYYNTEPVTQPAPAPPQGTTYYNTELQTPGAPPAGITYYYSETQQQVSPKRSPVRRTKAAIPIVSPQNPSGEDESYEEGESESFEDTSADSIVVNQVDEERPASAAETNRVKQEPTDSHIDTVQTHPNTEQSENRRVETQSTAHIEKGLVKDESKPVVEEITEHQNANADSETDIKKYIQTEV